jgi:hypothetical protein
MRNGGVTEYDKYEDEHTPAILFDKRIAVHVSLPLLIPFHHSFFFFVNYFLLWAMLSHPLNKVQMEICGGIEDGSPITNVGDDGVGID